MYGTEIELVVEHDREVLEDALRRLAPAASCAWPRWAILRVTFCQILRPLSVKSNVTFGWPLPPGAVVEVLLGVLDVGAASAGSSLRT